MDSTQQKEQEGIGVLPENILNTESVGGESTTVLLDTPLPWYKNTKLVVAIIVALILLGGSGLYAYTMYATGGTVATVNGKKIYQKEFNESVALIQQNATLQGVETTPTDLNAQALEVLINNALLITAAEGAGFEVTDEDIQKKFDELTTQLGGAEALTAKMLEVGLTEEKLRQNIAERILSDLYIESVTGIEDLSVSDEEVAEFIKTIDVGDAELPPLEEIRPQIESTILTQKQQQIVTDLLTKLRSEATIDSTL